MRELGLAYSRTLACGTGGREPGVPFLGPSSDRDVAIPGWRPSTGVGISL